VPVYAEYKWYPSKVPIERALAWVSGIISAAGQPRNDFATRCHARAFLIKRDSVATAAKVKLGPG
jgi:hypothetical protein